MSLGKASFDRLLKEGYADFLALRFALFSPFKRKRGDLRGDLIHMFALSQIWEIKPVTGAVQGVLQETYYRTAYNVFAYLLSKDAVALQIPHGPGLPRLLKTQRLFSGGSWSEHKGLLDPFPLINNKGNLSIAVPFCVPKFRGLVLYFLLDALKAQELEALITATIASLIAGVKKLLEQLKRLKKMTEEAAEAIEAFLEAAMPYIFEGFKYFLIFILVAVAFLAIASSTPEVFAVLALAGFIHVLFKSKQDSQELGRSEVDPLTQNFQSPSRRRNTSATLEFGFCTLANFPLRTYPRFVKTAEEVVHATILASLEQLRDAAKNPGLASADEETESV